MTNDTLQRDVSDLRRRMELAETKLSQQAGQFEFISGQLRDVQLYIHAKFGEVDARFDKLEDRFDRLEVRFDKLEVRFDTMEVRFDTMEAKVDALPRVLAEMIAKTNKTKK